MVDRYPSGYKTLRELYTNYQHGAITEYETSF